MVSLHRNVIHVILIIICINISVNARKKKYTCPIGFSLAFTKDKDDDPICYVRKGPERFEDKFEGCTGNLYTAELYNKLNFTDDDVVLWTDYKSSYAGGPFIDYSFTSSAGELLPTSSEVKDVVLALNEEMCVVIEPAGNYTATRCNNKYYRYCFVEPYNDDEDQDGCDDDDIDFYRFYSPRAACLVALSGFKGGTVRANWKTSKELCAKRGGALLSKGWTYANSPKLSNSPKATFPLGIVLSRDNSTIKYDTSTEDGTIPKSEWYFENRSTTPDASLGALRDGFWYMVNNSYIFYNVICERPIQLKTVSLNVSVEMDKKLILKASNYINEIDIKCFSDGSKFYPTEVSVKYDEDSKYFVLKPHFDGYYWCISTDSKNQPVTESNKVLFIRDKESLINTYAIMLHSNREYKFNYPKILEQIYKDWQKKLEEYIFYKTKYITVFGELELSDAKSAEEILKGFKASHRDMKFRDTDIIKKFVVKRLFLDGKSALVHVRLNPEIMAVGPGQWDGLEIRYMKPVYFCKGFDSVPTLQLGNSTTTNGCRNYTCVGEFNEGVQWLMTAADGCTTLAPVTLESKVKVHAEVHDFMPTLPPLPSKAADISTSWSDSDEEESTVRSTTTWSPTKPPFPTTNDPTVVSTVTSPYIPTETVSTVMPVIPTETVSTAMPTISPPTLAPDEQLREVINNLENLLQQNDSIPVTVADVEETFDEVDRLFDIDDDLDIPGELLHLLDALGGRVDLNGSNQALAVRNNIAMVLADATPNAPVRGLRIAARENEQFTDEAFEIITDEVNETQLQANQSEAIVNFPDSIVNSTRRISFVVFRNDLAFRSGQYALNSKVLSIKVENLTTFEDGEVVDIHLSPMREDLDRNISRACAYWHFLEDGSGLWSQDGCTLIRSQDGMLDACRCTHLTHFAEILVPNSVFSERNEKSLEVITIIGCFMSLFGLIMIAVTAAIFRSWRRDFSNKIWLQLCIAIFFVITSFLIVIFSNFDHDNIYCMLIGIFLHYSTLASFCWMLVAAILSYRRLVIVFSRDASHKLLRAAAFAWGTPFAVIGVLLSIDPLAYLGQFEEKTPTGSFCYPTGLNLWLTVYAPIAIMLLANWTLFALIVRSVFASRGIQRHGDTNEALRCASVSCLLVFLFGLPWVFGLFAWNIVAAYLFTLTATFQGFVLFLFFVVGNKKTRDLWLNKLKIKQTRKIPVTSSTYTNRSTGPGYRPGPGPTAIEISLQKPRSLTSPDNSRFS